MTTPRRVKVAVIGSGLAGLTAAYRLSKTPRVEDVEFEVHLFEKASSVGMDSHSVSLTLPGHDDEIRVDVPMRSFQGGYYPQLISLYKHLGVQFRQTDFSYSFSTLLSSPFEKPEMKTTMIYNGASGREGVGMPTSLFPPAQKQQSIFDLPPLLIARTRAYAQFMLSTILLLVFYIRLLLYSLPLRPVNVTSKKGHISSISDWIYYLLPTRPPPSTTLRTWTEDTTPTSIISRYLGLDSQWKAFVSGVIIPLFSAVCTAGEEHIWEMLIEEMLDYIYQTFGTHHYVVINGVRDVARRITSCMPPDQIHLSTPITSLSISQSNNRYRSRGTMMVDINCSNGKVYHGFSHVIFATQANHAGPLISTYLDTLPISSGLERHRNLVKAQLDCLSQFTYCRSVVINHTDSSLLPPNSRDRRDLNLICASPSPSSLTVLQDKCSNTVSSWREESDDICLPPTYTMATHVITSTAFKSSTRIYQTTNPIIPPAKDDILSVAKLERAVVDVKGKEALKGLWRESWDTPDKGDVLRWGCAGEDGGILGPLQGAGRLESPASGQIPGIWICGSFAHCGIPLLEGCVVSARNVVEQGIWVSEGLDPSRGEKLW